MTRSINNAAFTLVELILVMMLLATACALIAPSLSKSFRGRNLDQEASRFYALTEYARDEAASQGIPMVIWIEPENGKFGVKPKDGYPAIQGRTFQYTLCSDVHFASSLASKPGGTDIIEFSPSGNLEISSVDSILFKDGSNIMVSVAKMKNGAGYEIQKGNEIAQN